MRLSVSSDLLIEVVEEGALVFDSSSGATTLISNDALLVVGAVRRLGTPDEADLEATSGLMLAEGSNLSSILASLEKTRLVFRC